MRPPINACDELDGSPNHQVMRFQTIAPMTAASTVVSVASPVSMIPSPTVLATAVVTNAPARLAIDGDQHRHARRQRARGDRRGNGVRRVVEAVREVEAERDDDRDDEERCGHASSGS